ncbi:MAG: 3-dehydroquinate synthase [Deltaproteobacteria bacterium]|nr:MAG: 3-dehydroquinate synthase [Deltaproteobacteria bacterium]
MEVVNVELGARRYPIYVGAGCLRELGTKLAETRCGAGVAVVTNSTVADLYLDRALASLRDAAFEPIAIQIPDGEEHKNLAWLAFVYDKLIDAGVERSGAVIALGGGVVGDLAGFAAATYLRGIPCVQVPTTLLAQVDSAIGGKTGINHVAGKNLIGAFAQPRFVLADVETLRTLPRRELIAGLAEVVKYGIILDPGLFALIENQLSAVQHLERDLLARIVRMCCTLKALVVGEDETESGYRAVLNFGHTIAHGLESLTEYKQYLHGEAVAIGMVAAARISRRLGFCPDADYQRIRKLLERCGLPTEVPADLRGEPLALALRSDKKARGGLINFVCLEAIGKTRFERLTCDEIVKHL